jgi:hypothetical protein
MPSSEIKRLIVMGVLVLAVATAGILYFVLVHSPGEDRAETERQITEWESSWIAARDCLLGDQPMADDVADAMVARELAIGTTEDAMGDCTKLVGGLVRPDGPEAIAAVEKVWPSVEEAGRKAAKAYILHRESPLAPTTLPADLGALAAGHAALRKAAGMKAPPPRSAAVFATITPVPLQLDGKPVSALVGETIGGVGFRGIARAGTETFDVSSKPDGTLTGVAIVEGDVLSRPTGAWRAGVDATPDGAALRLAPGTKPIATGGPGLQVFGVLGEAEERVIVFAESGQLVRVARSIDSGATWKVIDVPTAGSTSHAIDFAGGYIDLVWSTGTDVRWLRLEAKHARGALPAAAPLPGEPQRLDNTCVAGNSFWILGGYPPPTPPRLIQLAAQSQKHRSLEEASGRGGTITACSTTHVLVTPVDGPLVACDAERCEPVELPGLSKIAVLDGAIAVKQRSHLVGVWRGRGTPTFVKLDETWEVEGVTDLGAGPVIVVRHRADNVLATAKLP